MFVMVNEIPEKNAFRRRACRLGALESFMNSGYICAEYSPEADDNPRRAYNGLLMAIKRQYAGKIAISWRHGRVYLRKIGAEAG